MCVCVCDSLCAFGHITDLVYCICGDDSQCEINLCALTAGFVLPCVVLHFTPQIVVYITTQIGLLECKMSFTKKRRQIYIWGKDEGSL